VSFYFKKREKQKEASRGKEASKDDKVQEEKIWEVRLLASLGLLP